MTLVGKLLVFLNLVLGVGFFTWSLGLYTQRPDWFTATNDAGEKVDGRFMRLKNEFTALESAAKTAAKRWGAGAGDLEAKEATRKDRQTKLADRLKTAREGTPGFFEQTYLPDGLLNLELQGPPDKGPDDQPLRGAGTLLDAFNANVTAIGAATSASAKLRTQQFNLGVQVQFKDEHLQKQLVVLGDLRTELDYLGRFRINWYAQLDTVLRRKMQLDRRLADLNGKGGAASPKPVAVESLSRAGR